MTKYCQSILLQNHPPKLTSCDRLQSPTASPARTMVYNLRRTYPSHHPSLTTHRRRPISADDDALHEFRRRENGYLNSLFKSSVELQLYSRNLVFYDRELGQVKEFPYPLRSIGQSFPIEPSGFKLYFKNKRTKFECFCGLLKDEPQFLSIRNSRFGHFMACWKCGLYVSLDAKHQTANIFAIYPTNDPDGGVQPATLSSARIVRNVPHRVNRSNRRLCIDYQPYYKDEHNVIYYPGPSDSHNSSDEAHYPLPTFQVKKDSSSAASSASGSLKRESSQDASSDFQIQFCRYCEYGILDNFEAHEAQCTGPKTPSEHRFV